MGIKLSDVEQRVLGVLIEKSLTQPAGYPMTINALVLGANQKQNRDPVTSYSEADVSRALHDLSLKQLAKQAPPGPGARANRFEHTVVETCHWDRRDQAILAELMLRGRQTPGELRGRASRMTSFPDLPSVMTTLEGLARRDPPLVEELPREPGRSANRFRHLLSDDPGPNPDDGVVHGTVLSQSDPASREPGQSLPATSIAGHPNQRLEERLSRLEEEVRVLAARLDAAGFPASRVEAGQSGAIDASGSPPI